VTPSAEEPVGAVGLFGGTFDPPHRGHVTVAGDVADALDLERVLWMPAARSPFKQVDDQTSAELRWEMVRAAATLNPRFQARDDELRRGGTSYTVETLRRLRDELGPDPTIYLILGADQLADFHRWREPEAILELARLAVMDREGRAASAVAPDLPGMEDAVYVPVTRVDVSSTRIRSRLAAGEAVADLVPDPVLEVVERAGLYRSGPGLGEEHA